MDVDLPETIPPLLLDQHIDYLANYNQNKYEYTMTEHLRISGKAAGDGKSPCGKPNVLCFA